MRKRMSFILGTLLAFTVQCMAQGDVYERSKVYEWPTDQLVVDNPSAMKTG